MAFDRNKLRGRIVEKYGSQANFAKAIGESDVVISGKLTGLRGMTYDNVIVWADALDIDVQDIGTYFFTTKV